MTNVSGQEDIAEKASEFLLGVLERMGVTADIEVHDEDERITLEVQTADADLITGKRGVVIDALQHMVNKVVYKERGGEKGRPFIVDAGGYRAKHIEWLQQLGQRMAEKALSTNQVVELQPMSAHDRRVVHMKVSEIAGITTRSEGEGDDRHICLIPDPSAAAVARS